MGTQTPIKPSSTEKLTPQPVKTQPQSWANLRLFGNGRRPRGFRSGVEVRSSALT